MRRNGARGALTYEVTLFLKRRSVKPSFAGRLVRDCARAGGGSRFVPLPGVFPLKKGKREAAARAARPEVGGKTRFFAKRQAVWFETQRVSN